MNLTVNDWPVQSSTQEGGEPQSTLSQWQNDFIWVYDSKKLFFFLPWVNIVVLPFKDF